MLTVVSDVGIANACSDSTSVVINLSIIVMICVILGGDGITTGVHVR